MRNGKKSFQASFRTVDLAKHVNWPKGKTTGKWWQELVQHVRTYPQGPQTAWGIPFRMGQQHRVILAAKGQDTAIIPLTGSATYLCLLHDWRQITETIQSKNPTEGLVVAEYELTYRDGTTHVQPVRARFEVLMSESPGPPWLAMPFRMAGTIDAAQPPANLPWGHAQYGLKFPAGLPLVYALPNPHPNKPLRSLTLRGLQESPLLVAGLTLYTGQSHPLRHLPRRTYRLQSTGEPVKIETAEIDLGVVTRIEKTTGPRTQQWLTAPNAGLLQAEEPARSAEQLIEASGAEDATLTVKLSGKPKPIKFTLGQAFQKGTSPADTGRVILQVLGNDRQWMQVIVRDAGTGQPTPVRIHLSGSRGEYLAPYGHHSQINPGWFMDYGADVLVKGRSYAYVAGEFTTELPVGDVYVEICKGFEYTPLRQKVTIQPGQKVLELAVSRFTDWRRQGWVTADSHVHFISPHTAALQAQGEGINIVNLLASQWGRLFTNVGDIRGRANVVEDDTIVYVGTENRNHMLGHLSLLGTQGQPVYPMCGGGPNEAWVGDPDFLTMADWARQNRQQGGLVIRPHFPYCGHTEDPVLILKGLIDAVELYPLHGNAMADFQAQEWYRYLNCGYRVAVVGGTDKMGADSALGWMRTYALTDRDKPFDYDNWSAAVRAGRTFTSTGPLIDLAVDGVSIGGTIDMPAAGGVVEVQIGRAHV